MANFKKCFRKIAKLSSEDRSVELLAENFNYKCVVDGDGKSKVSSPYLEGLVLWVSGVPFRLDSDRLRRIHGPLAYQKVSQAVSEWHNEEDRGGVVI